MMVPTEKIKILVIQFGNYSKLWANRIGFDDAGLIIGKFSTSKWVTEGWKKKLWLLNINIKKFKTL